MIVFSVKGKEEDCHQNGDCFCRRDSQPDAVDTKEFRQDQDASCNKNEGTQEGDHRGYLPVGQSRKEGGREDIDTCKQEVPHKDFIAVQSDGIGICFRCGKNTDRRYSHQIRETKAYNGGNQDDAKAHLEQAFQLWDVSVTIVITEHGSSTAGKAQICRSEQELGVEYDGDGGYAVFPQKLHHCQIEQECCYGHGSGGHHFRGTVQERMGDGGAVPFGFYEVQYCSGLCKVEQCRNAADNEAADSAPCCPNDPHIQKDDEDIVEDDVGDAGTYIQPQAEIWFAGGDEQRLKQGLYHGDGIESHHDTAVFYTIRQQVFIGTQEQGKGADENETEDGDDQPCYNGKGGDKGKGAAGLIFLAFPQASANDGRAAGAQHDTQTDQDIDQRENDIHGGEGGRSYIAGNENTVYDGVGCHKYQHDNGGQSKFD